jgi:hypothetical protein
LFLTGLNKAALSASYSTESEQPALERAIEAICELVGFGGGDNAWATRSKENPLGPKPEGIPRDASIT